ncbi:putative quinol monooxygenase [Paenarthrobacter sp. NPDC018779]|uniref:putative quinol monooxygenase n=1 Tax=Paenarthrobacter sp. NPDC018779 TaxID=3364375 RepID=UPI0037C86E34
MTEVSLTGQLVCRDLDEVAIVVEHLAGHIELTLAEPGCVSFRVNPTADPLVWQVDEVFHDAPAFRAHQARVAASAWGGATTEIERRYTVTGL